MSLKVVKYHFCCFDKTNVVNCFAIIINSISKLVNLGLNVNSILPWKTRIDQQNVKNSINISANDVPDQMHDLLTDVSMASDKDAHD